MSKSTSKRATITPVRVSDRVRQLLDGGDESTAARMLEAVEPTTRATRMGPTPRAGSTGKPITFKASEEERAAYEAHAEEDGASDLSAWIRDCLAERMALGRRRR